MVWGHVGKILTWFQTGLSFLIWDVNETLRFRNGLYKFHRYAPQFDPSVEVMGITPARDGEFSFMVSIQERDSGRHVCSGIILDAVHILTTALCVEDKLSRELKVYAGSSTLASPSDKSFLKRSWSGETSRLLKEPKVLLFLRDTIDDLITFKTNKRARVRAKLERMLIEKMGLFGGMVPAHTKFTDVHRRSSSIQYGPQTINVQAILVHELFARDRLDHNIALIALETPLEFDEYLKPAKLPTLGESVKESEKVNSTFWGTTPLLPDDGMDFGDGDFISNYVEAKQDVEEAFEEIFALSSRSTRLVTLSLVVMSKNECHSEYQAITGSRELFTSLICARKQNSYGRGCLGDQGGALTVLKTDRDGIEHRLVLGLLSFGLKCLKYGWENHPAVFTDIAGYMDWISEKTQINVRVGR